MLLPSTPDDFTQLACGSPALAPRLGRTNLWGGAMTMHDDVILAEIDAALTTLCQHLTRAVNTPDLPNVRRFLERIDELLEARTTLTRDLPAMQPTT
jgi:hypothetical protein